MSRHRADVLSLLTGLALCGLGLGFLLGPDTAVPLIAALSWPVVLAALALALLAGAVSRRRARRRAGRARRDAQASGVSSSETEFMQ